MVRKISKTQTIEAVICRQPTMVMFSYKHGTATCIPRFSKGSHGSWKPGMRGLCPPKPLAQGRAGWWLVSWWGGTWKARGEKPETGKDAVLGLRCFLWSSGIQQLKRNLQTVLIFFLRFYFFLPRRAFWLRFVSQLLQMGGSISHCGYVSSIVFSSLSSLKQVLTGRMPFSCEAVVSYFLSFNSNTWLDLTEEGCTTSHQWSHEGILCCILPCKFKTNKNKTKNPLQNPNKKPNHKTRKTPLNKRKGGTQMYKQQTELLDHTGLAWLLNVKAVSYFHAVLQSTALIKGCNS